MEYRETLEDNLARRALLRIKKKSLAFKSIFQQITPSLLQFRTSSNSKTLEDDEMMTFRELLKT